jgi:hypothetical protein
MIDHGSKQGNLAKEEEADSQAGLSPGRGKKRKKVMWSCRYAFEAASILFPRVAGDISSRFC